MDLKSSAVVDGAKKEELEKTTELSTDFESLALGKEEEEEDSEEEEEEDEDRDSCESDQEWDVDSFEGVEFHPDEEDGDDWNSYLKQCYISEGFHVDMEHLPTDPGRIYSGWNPIKLDAYFSPPNITGRQYMENMLKVVIDKFNQTKGKNLAMDHIVRTVAIIGGGVKAYITFMAKESPEKEELVEFQAKAEWKVWQRNVHPLLY